VRWIVAAAVVLAACGRAGGGTNPSAPVATTAPVATSERGPPTTSPGVQPVGFDLVAVRVTNADGSVCELCTWRAATSAARQQGLMGVTDLGPADGMVFIYDAPATGRFWMSGTPMPLDIAWFGDDGTFVSAASMAPCLDGPSSACPRYGAEGPYAVALEVPTGDLADLGIGPGSVAAVGTGDGCDTP